MITKELLKTEIDQIQEQYLEVLLKHSKNHKTFISPV